MLTSFEKSNPFDIPLQTMLTNHPTIRHLVRAVFIQSFISALFKVNHCLRWYFNRVACFWITTTNTWSSMMDVKSIKTVDKNDMIVSNWHIAQLHSPYSSLQSGQS
jgi:hypothetical protein